MHRAVIFDLGGVVLDSPMLGIARYEQEVGLEPGFINRRIVETGDDGAWARLEQGRLDMAQFFDAFERDCAAVGAQISARDLMARMGESGGVRPVMLEAIRRIRDRGLAVAALTNNWKTPEADPGNQDSSRTELQEHFDLFVESSVVGLSKPDPRIYLHACERLAIEPSDAIFLDDIGRNLKAARQLGMATIKVESAEQALGELENALGFPLRSEPLESA
jgi:epoxide hydrolase-like predicted phosphatase